MRKRRCWTSSRTLQTSSPAERIPRRHKMLEAEIEHVVHVCVKLPRISALAFLRRECVMTHRRRVEQRQSFAVRGNRLALRVGGDRATAIVPSFSHLRSVKRTSKASLVPLSCVRSSTGETPVVDQARPFGFFSTHFVRFPYRRTNPGSLAAASRKNVRFRIETEAGSLTTAPPCKIFTEKNTRDTMCTG